MTPREALYHLVMELGPVPQTTRNDNLTPKEVLLRDSVNVLQELIKEDESSAQSDYAELRESLNEYWRHTIAKQ